MESQTNSEKAIVYDLPSENMRIYTDGEVRDRVRAVRVRSTQLLHGLGVQCTESVILVPSTRVGKWSIGDRFIWSY